jgi:hypothetical protein
MLDLGIKVKVDLIIGLPGDTVDSVRRGIEYVRNSGLYSQVQVFNLAVLPGTSFRQEAEHLGLIYQDRPPYYVLETPTLSTEQMYDLMAEAEDAFETEFDPLPEVEWPVVSGQWPASEPRPLGSAGGSVFGVEGSERLAAMPSTCQESGVRSQGSESGEQESVISAGDGIAGILLPSPLAGEGSGVRGVASHLCVDLDEHIDASIPPAANRAQAFTLWLRSSNFSSHRIRAAEWIDQLLTANPFTTLQIVLEPSAEPSPLGRGQGEGVEAGAANLSCSLTPKFCESILRSVFRQPTYLDRFYSVQPGRVKGAKRLIIILPADSFAEDPQPKWLAELEEFATIVRRPETAHAVDQSAVISATRTVPARV